MLTCPRRVSSSCSTDGTHRVNQNINLVNSYNGVRRRGDFMSKTSGYIKDKVLRVFSWEHLTCGINW